jgi:hypothetical protein
MLNAPAFAMETSLSPTHILRTQGIAKEEIPFYNRDQPSNRKVGKTKKKTKFEAAKYSCNPIDDYNIWCFGKW